MIHSAARTSVLVIACIVLSCVVQTLSLGCSDVVDGILLVSASTKSINGNTLWSCKALIKTISFESPSQLRTIEDNAFSFSGLTAIIIPATVHTIGSGAFRGAASLTSVNYNCSTSAAPPRLSVGIDAFKDTPYATNGRAVPAASCRVIDLPIDCSAVVNGHLLVPSSIQSIARQAISYCGALKTIEFVSPSQLRTIEDWAFQNSGLTTISIPATVQSIGKWAFAGASSLVSVNYNCSTGTNPSPLSVGVSAFMSTPYATNGRAVPLASCRVVDFPFDCSAVVNGNAVVPSSVQSIKADAFGGCNALKTISFASPSQLKTIEDNAFASSGMVVIILPASVQVIGQRAFSGARSLTSVTYNCSSTPLSVGLNAFQDTLYAANGRVVPAASCRVVDLPLDCSAVVDGHVVVPSTTQSIGSNAFSSCNYLIKTISFVSPSQLQTIEDYAFSYSGLIAISFPSSIRRIVRSAFYGCSALKTISFASPSQLQVIEDWTFFNTGLTAIVLPASLQIIGQQAFSGTNSLASVTYNCSKSTAPSRLSVGLNAFKGTAYAANGRAVPAASCKVINLPIDCSAVVSGHVVVPSSIQSIAPDAFSGCNDLKTISFASPSQLQTIEDNAFSKSGLTSISIPATVQTISREAFAGATSLASVTYNCSSKPLSLGLNAFLDTPYAANGRVVPLASCRVVDLPLDCTAVVGGHVVIPSSIEAIESNAFSDCSALKTISFASPSQLRTIEKRAFQASELEALHLPASVQVIGQRAFYGARNLVSVTYNCSSSNVPLSVGVDVFLDTPYAANGRAVPAASCRVVNLPIDCSAVVNGNVAVPSSTYRIFPYSFDRCTDLKTISFASASQLRMIDDYAFYNSGLTAIRVPASVQFIGESSFHYINDLTSVTYECSAGTTPSPLSVGSNAFKDTPYAANGRAGPAASCRVVEFPLDCTSVVNGHIVVQSSVQSITRNSFGNCKDLKTISFESPSQVKKIENGAFEYSGLTAINIPASVQTIDQDAFTGADSLAYVTYDCSTTASPLSVGANAFAKTPYAANALVIPLPSCRVVNLPLGCSNVVNGNLRISKSLKTLYLRNSNFQGCTSVTSVTYDDDSQLESIGSDSFKGSSLVSIRIPSTVQLISNEVFADSLIETVTYDCSDQPLFIASRAFLGTPYEASGLVTPDASCRRIEFALDPSIVHAGHLIVPAATTRIDRDSFEIDYVSVTSVIFETGSQLKVIGDRAFDFLYVTSIDIPMSVESIEDWAFAGSFALSSMTFSCSSHSLTIAAKAFVGTALTSIALPPGAVYEGPVEVTALKCPSTSTVTCDAGQYLKNKGKINEACQACPAGKYTRSNGNRKKKCPRCPHGTYQPEEGQSTCLICPEGFRSKGQRGGPNCYHKKTYRPMRPSDLLDHPEHPVAGGN